MKLEMGRKTNRRRGTRGKGARVGTSVWIIGQVVGGRPGRGDERWQGGHRAIRHASRRPLWSPFTGDVILPPPDSRNSGPEEVEAAEKAGEGSCSLTRTAVETQSCAHTRFRAFLVV